MKATIKELKEKYSLYIVKDCQEWEAVEGVDYNNDSDAVEYEINTNLNGDEYALIKTNELTTADLFDILEAVRGVLTINGLVNAEEYEPSDLKDYILLNKDELKNLWRVFNKVDRKITDDLNK